MQADSSLWADALLGGRLVYEEGKYCRYDYLSIDADERE